MKKILVFLGCVILLLSCSENQANDTLVPVNTRKEYIQTSNNPKNEAVISQVIADLKSEKFQLKNRDIHPMDSFYDFNKDVQYILQGDGINAYYFKRVEAKPENYYPDFTITVFQFNSENAAKSCFDKIEKGAKGGMQNRESIGLKNPRTILQKGKEVVYLSTRAEMFRGYIDDCAKRIEGY